MPKMRTQNKIIQKKTKIISIVVLCSYLFLLSVTTLHQHNTEVNYHTQLSVTKTSENSSGIHDPSKCTILHFANFQTVVKQAFVIDLDINELIVNLDSNKFHLLSSKYLLSKSRAHPSHIS